MRRSGFTLLELTVALAVTGIVALIVYGTVAAAGDTERRVLATEAALRRDVAWRAIVHDALRNVRSTADYDDAAFAVEPRAGPAGESRDRVSFVTAGGTPPLIPDVDWRVTIEVDAGGLRLLASPITGAPMPAIELRWPMVTALDVRVLDDGGWQEVWRRVALPRSVSLTTYHENGESPPSLVVTLPERRR